jgi:hypothetical protein
VRTGTLHQLSAVFILLAAASGAPNAAGLFSDPRTLFPPVDTARTVVSVSMAGIRLADGDASLLGAEAHFRKGPRARIALAAQYPAVRSAGEIAHGVGDCFVSAFVRLMGDSLETSGLYLGASCRAPTGARALAPFSLASLDGSLGVEARGRISVFSARTSAYYTLAGERPAEGEFVHDRNASLAGLLSVDIPRVGSAAACAVWTGYHGGASRRTLCLALSVDLSETIALALSAAAESGNGGVAAYERMASAALSYRFPPRAASAPREPLTP